MRFAYACRLDLLRSCGKKLAIALGLIALPAAAQIAGVHLKTHSSSQQAVHKATSGALSDPRIDRLSNFLASLNCPVRSLASDFIAAADENHIDWRLLPSISVIESGGGKVYRNNNIFGWSNGNVLFSSIRHSIHEIAYRLGQSPLYRRQNTVGKLKIYNSDSDYVVNVLQVMNRISPTADVTRRQSF